VSTGRRIETNTDGLQRRPPCQPFANAGRRNGPLIPGSIPEFVRAFRAGSAAFVSECALVWADEAVCGYIQQALLSLVNPSSLRRFCLDAADFGLPPSVVGAYSSYGFCTRTPPILSFFFSPPPPLFFPPVARIAMPNWDPVVEIGACGELFACAEALGLPGNRFRYLAPTIRSGMTGQRHNHQQSLTNLR